MKGRSVVFSVEDQRDWQRLGGICARHPYSCFFCTVLDRLRDTFSLDSLVLDLTYGRGEFYVACSSRYTVYAVDIEEREWIAKPHSFRRCDALDIQCYSDYPEHGFDIIVVDPPYLVTPGSKSPAKMDREYLRHGGAASYYKLLYYLPVIVKKFLKPGGVVLVKGMERRRHWRLDLSTTPYAWAQELHRVGLEPVAVIYYRFFRSDYLVSDKNPFVTVHSWLLIARNPV